MPDSKLNHFLDTGSAFVEEYRLTVRQFMRQLLDLAGAAAVMCFVPAVLLACVWPSAFELIFRPETILLVYVLLVFDAWRQIGERTACVDLRLRQLVVDSRMPNVKGGIYTTRVPFSDLLLLRHWREGSEGQYEAFVLRLLDSKKVGNSPDVAGYFLHLEYACPNPEVAEAATAALAARFCSATGIDYFDVQDCKDEKYKLWSWKGLAPSDWCRNRSLMQPRRVAAFPR